MGRRRYNPGTDDDDDEESIVDQMNQRQPHESFDDYNDRMSDWYGEDWNDN